MAEMPKDSGKDSEDEVQAHEDIVRQQNGSSTTSTISQEQEGSSPVLLQAFEGAAFAEEQLGVAGLRGSTEQL